MTFPLPPDVESFEPGPRARRGLRALALAFTAGFAAGCLLLWAHQALGQPVTYVIDGDTVRLRDGRTVRLWNIDAPETLRARCEAEAALGFRAKERLARLLAAGPLAVILDEPKGRREDRYGRTLARLTVAGRDAGEQLIAEGLATRWPQRRDWCGAGR